MASETVLHGSIFVGAGAPIDASGTSLGARLHIGTVHLHFPAAEAGLAEAMADAARDWRCKQERIRQRLEVMRDDVMAPAWRRRLAAERLRALDSWGRVA